MAVDFLHPRRVPLESVQPTPPRRLKLPTVVPNVMRRLQNRTKVINVDDLLYPRPFGGRAGTTAPAQHATSTAEYLRGVGILAAYRMYFFPPLAVQWAMYAVWLQGHAAGLSLSALRTLDEQGRTHLAQYPNEYHCPAGLTESVQGLIRIDAHRPSPAPVSRPPAVAGSANRFQQRLGRQEPCLRWNGGRCTNGVTCFRAHVCATCRGPHQARFCPQQQGNGPRPLVAPLAGPY